ncbi:hypothetical protein PsorP6_016990 [Peronosclerospora sorghi]|uniref:Uncharacterized protein n=1 Tax=Peronosclerospora sorghi TaxID=230839 RepID=A0ACC0WE48_9STRA|nr:hypothetical protein PsorP6_016990 [Peronosclerospora sorghi]
MLLFSSVTKKTSTLPSHSVSGSKYNRNSFSLCHPGFQHMRKQCRPAHFHTINTSHVSGILFEQAAYCKTILEVVDFLKRGTEEWNPYQMPLLL